MFLHIGGSQIVFDYELVGIFNINLAGGMETATRDKLNIQAAALKSGYKDKQKSFVLTDKNIYLSPIAPLTLARRSKNRTKS